MKKLKIVCFSLMSIFLLFLGVFFVMPVRTFAGEFDNYWDGSTLAKSYYDFDGKGIRFFVAEIYGKEATGEIYYAMMCPVKEYYFDDDEFYVGNFYLFGRNYFDAYLLHYPFKNALQYYGSASSIPEWDRIYVYFQPWNNLFTFEFRGSDLEYAVFCIEEYYYNGWDVGYDFGREDGLQDGYDYGYNYGYNEGYEVGYDEGYIEGVDLGYHDGYYEGYLDGLYISECGPIYEQGFADGQESRLAENNASFYQGIEKWLVPAIIAVIALGGFVTIAVNKRRGE